MATTWPCCPHPAEPSGGPLKRRRTPLGSVPSGTSPADATTLPANTDLHAACAAAHQALGLTSSCSLAPAQLGAADVGLPSCRPAAQLPPTFPVGPQHSVPSVLLELWVEPSACNLQRQGEGQAGGVALRAQEAGAAQGAGGAPSRPTWARLFLSVAAGGFCRAAAAALSTGGAAGVQLLPVLPVRLPAMELHSDVLSHVAWAQLQVCKWCNCFSDFSVSSPSLSLIIQSLCGPL